VNQPSSVWQTSALAQVQAFAEPAQVNGTDSGSLLITQRSCVPWTILQVTSPRCPSGGQANRTTYYPDDQQWSFIALPLIPAQSGFIFGKIEINQSSLAIAIAPANPEKLFKPGGIIYASLQSKISFFAT
jgi:hypothetical protein